MNLKGLKPRNVKMDNFELLKITEGKNRKESLVFHVKDLKRKDLSAKFDHIEVIFLVILQINHVTIVIRCLNSWSTKSHDPCRAHYTVMYILSFSVCIFVH